MSNVIKLSSNVSNLIKGYQSTNGANLEELREVDTEYNSFLKPRLLTTLVGSAVNTHRTKSFTYDSLDQTAVLPAGKRYDQPGPMTKKDGYTQNIWQIPSVGLQYSIECTEYGSKRKPGTTDEFMDFNFLNAREQVRVMDSFDLYNELNVGSIITSDTPSYLGAPIVEPNYYDEITGSTRVADGTDNTNVSAASDPSDYRATIEDAIDTATENLAKRGRSAQRWVFVCGKNYFNMVRSFEAQENLPREIRGIDLAQEGMPMMSDGEFSNIRFMDGSDGALYLKYTANILGTKIIGDDNGYLIPVGVENMWSIELAPAETMETINSEAQAMYMWSEENKRQAMFEFESNRAMLNKVPEAIQKFTRVA